MHFSAPLSSPLIGQILVYENQPLRGTSRPGTTNSREPPNTDTGHIPQLQTQPSLASLGTDRKSQKFQKPQPRAKPPETLIDFFTKA